MRLGTRWDAPQQHGLEHGSPSPSAPLEVFWGSGALPDALMGWVSMKIFPHLKPGPEGIKCRSLAAAPRGGSLQTSDRFQLRALHR